MTQKISISVDRADLALLKRRAQELYGGNLSAVVGEGVRHLREQEGREALARWLGKAGETTESQREAIRAEWRQPAIRAQRRRRGCAVRVMPV